MLDVQKLRRLVPPAVFFALYTLLFLLWKWTFLYTLPFLLGLALAAVLQPVIRWTEKRGLPHRAASGLVTVTALVLALFGTGFLLVLAVRELTGFLGTAMNGGFPEFSPPVRAFFRWAGEKLSKLRGDFFLENRERLMELLQNSAELVLNVLGAALKLLTSLPTLLTLALVTGVSAYFLARDYEKLKSFARGFLTDRTAGKLRSAREGSAGKRYLASYALIYFISFSEAFIVLSVVGAPYPLTTALLTCIADVLPVLGPGFVLGPVAVYQALTGAYGRALGLLVGWAVMGCVRQVIEPKLVADTAKLHPLSMLAAVYFSLAAGSLWVLVYTAGFFLAYGFLRRAGILPELREKEPEEVQSGDETPS